jgi:hypothetical protein
MIAETVGLVRFIIVDYLIGLIDCLQRIAGPLIPCGTLFDGLQRTEGWRDLDSRGLLY